MEQFKHYSFRGKKSLSQPSLLFQVRLDVHDHRSGFFALVEELFEGPWLADRELQWTRDMVHAIDESTLEEIEPREGAVWPAWAEVKIRRYLSHFHRFSIWRNYDLSIYSEPRESKEEFLRRCEVLETDERDHQLEKIRDIFLRRFLEVEGRLLGEGAEAPWEAKSREGRLSEIRDVFSQVRERFSCCFLKEDLSPLTEEDFSWTVTIDIESRERLEALRAEFISQYNEISDFARRRAHAVERYEVPLAHSQVEIVSRGILWR